MLIVTLSFTTQQRPVSSLLSHFENLAHRESPSAADEPSRLLSPTDSNGGEDSRASGRASFDVVRPRSSWDEPRQPSQQPGPPVSVRKERPVSANFPPSSPTKQPPALAVQSPRSPSPPHAPDNTEEDHNQSTTVANAHPSQNPRESLSPSPFPPRISSRPTTPISVSPASNEQSLKTPPVPSNDGHLSPSPSPRKSKSPPPPVNRADKPKVPLKPSNLTHLDGVSHAPQHQPEAPAVRPVSPFSTPPSSPERNQQRQHTPSDKPSKFVLEPVAGRQSLEATPPRPLPLRDVRDQGFTRRPPPPPPVQIPEPPRETKPSMMQTYPPPPPPPTAASSLSTTRPEPVPPPRASLDAPRQSRPNLPPRQPPLPRRSGVSPPRPQVQNAAGYPPRPVPSAKAENTTTYSNGNRILNNNTQQQVPPPPPLYPPYSFPRSSAREMPSDRQSSPGAGSPAVEPSEEPKFRSNFPDPRQVNRRRPHMRNGPAEINAKYDTRLFDVCGKYVCTTGFLTRAWDLTTGEQLMTVTHGENVKCLSISFKPCQGLQDEGQRLWVGTSTGELHEIDIASQAIVSARAYPSRREVIKIHRHKKEMWTMDEEGRLLVWYPDEGGTPNLQHSPHNPPDRVARGHTFSMVVGDQLWLAAGKDVYIYQPNATDSASFKVIRRPLGQNHTGDVTSGAYANKDGGRIYLGHSDGKISVYSAADISCITIVTASVYKVTSMSFVGNLLWAAYTTGMILVYDTSQNPWIVKKDWKAHDTPISGLLLDASSLWMLNRMQVTSLGDNYIRFWDGLLEDDWLGMF